MTTASLDTKTPLYFAQKSDKTAAILNSLASVTVGYLVLLVLCGSIVSGIWLAVKGALFLVFVGIACALFFAFAYPIAALPGVWLMSLAIHARKHSNSWLKYATFGIASALWFSLIVACWTYSTFWNFIQFAEPGLTLPLLLWGYAVTMSPLVLMPSASEQITVARILLLIYAALTYALLAILHSVGFSQQTMICSVAVLAILESIRRTQEAYTSWLSPEQFTDCVVADFKEAFALCQDEQWLFKPQSLLSFDPQTTADLMKWSCRLHDTPVERLESTHYYYRQISFFIPDDQFERSHAYFQRFAQRNKICGAENGDYETALEFLTQPPNYVAHGFFEHGFLVDTPDDPDKAWVQQLARKCWGNYLAQDVDWKTFVNKVETENSFVDAEERPGDIPEFTSPGSVR